MLNFQLKLTEHDNHSAFYIVGKDPFLLLFCSICRKLAEKAQKNNVKISYYYVFYHNFIFLNADFQM